MAILLLFEKTDELTGREIQDGTQLSGDQLQKQLQSLIDAKLLKDPESEVKILQGSNISLKKKTWSFQFVSILAYFISFSAPQNIYCILL